ncbi:double-stranded DNA-dependent ATPase [Saccharomycopsis crataegensis]|uniref:Double-stranded DNA-dependent ATPase n=1 Tax=Saccharomycopsis crataegensis TaxID=43959 RepID=A0AAV5QIM3_9ASCO|nr:double-stranded DNA-dependent ATPase [Saccharomycopsis crataegensis]
MIRSLAPSINRSHAVFRHRLTRICIMSQCQAFHTDSLTSYMEQLALSPSPSPQKNLPDQFKPVQKIEGIFGNSADTTGLQLRDYQKDCIVKCLRAFDQGKRRIAVSLATGGGKTVVFSSLIKHMAPLTESQGDKTLILVHRKELCEQAAATCARIMPEKVVEIDIGGNKASGMADITVASIQSLNRGDRLSKYDPKDYKLIIIDEAHHAAAKSYINILQNFNAHNTETKVAVVGFSATLDRHDGKSLADSMDYVVFHKGLDEMVTDGWLCDAKVTVVRDDDLDLSSVIVREEDFTITGLSKAVNTEKSNDLILQTYLKYREEDHFESTLIFGVDVDHVQALRDLFAANDIKAECVTGKTAASTRSKVVTDFKSKKINVLVNCGIFTEGTDIPNIDSIILARPTKSKNLLSQMIGRGLRKHDAKELCHIISFIPVSIEVATVPTLLGISYQLPTKKFNTNMMSSFSREKPLLREFSQDKLNFKLFASLRDFAYQPSRKESDAKYFTKDSLAWIRSDKETWLLEFRSGYVRVTKTPSPIDGGESSFLTKFYEALGASFRYTIAEEFMKSSVLETISTVHEKLKEYAPSQYYPRKHASWRFQSATAGQKKAILGYFGRTLSKMSLKVSMIPFKEILEKTIDGMNKGTCSDLIFMQTLGSKEFHKRIIQAIESKMLLVDKKTETKPGKSAIPIDQFRAHEDIGRTKKINRRA